MKLKKQIKVKKQRLQAVFEITAISLALCALRLPATNAVFTDKDRVEENSVATGYWVDPHVEVLSPNGGEDYEPDEEITIEWEAHSTDPGSSITSAVYFSDNAGASYTLIISGLVDIFTYDWTLPGIKSDQMLIKVEVEDEHGLTNNDESDAVFDPVVKEDEDKDKDKDRDDKKEEEPVEHNEPVEVITEPVVETEPDPIEPELPEEEPSAPIEEEVLEEEEIIEAEPETETENSQEIETSSAPSEEAQDAE